MLSTEYPSSFVNTAAAAAPSIWPRLFCGAGHETRRGE